MKPLVKNLFEGYFFLENNLLKMFFYLPKKIKGISDLLKWLNRKKINTISFYHSKTRGPNRKKRVEDIFLSWFLYRKLFLKGLMSSLSTLSIKKDKPQISYTNF